MPIARQICEMDFSKLHSNFKFRAMSMLANHVSVQSLSAGYPKPTNFFSEFLHQ
jgi:hypothetical protein